MSSWLKKYRIKNKDNSAPRFLFWPQVVIQFYALTKMENKNARIPLYVFVVSFVLFVILFSIQFTSSLIVGPITIIDGVIQLVLTC
jgi:hypothetical protein